MEARLNAAQDTNSNASYTDYVGLAAAPYVIRVTNDELNTTVSIDKERYSSAIPTYISDIMTLSETFIKEKNCVLEGIYCFDADTSHQGIAVYLKTDKGVYVRYYETSTSEAMLFSEDEFRVKADAYYQHLTSYENNYNENGEALGGSGMSFLSFVQGSVNPDAAVLLTIFTGGMVL